MSFYPIGAFTLNVRVGVPEEKFELEELRLWLLYHCNEVNFSSLWKEKCNNLPDSIKEVLKGKDLSDQEIMDKDKLDSFFTNLISALGTPNPEEFSNALARLNYVNFGSLYTTWQGSDEQEKQRVWEESQKACPKLKQIIYKTLLEEEKNKIDTYQFFQKIKKQIEIYDPELIKTFSQKIAQTSS